MRARAAEGWPNEQKGGRRSNGRDQVVWSERAVVEWWIRDSGAIEDSRHRDEM
jgi:hypothetical protein